EARAPTRPPPPWVDRRGSCRAALPPALGESPTRGGRPLTRSRRRIARRRRGGGVAYLRYELTLKGAATDTLAGAFADCEVERRRGVTVVRTVVPDSAGLQGLVARVGALGLELLDAHLVAELAEGEEVWEAGP